MLNMFHRDLVWEQDQPLTDLDCTLKYLLAAFKINIEQAGLPGTSIEVVSLGDRRTGRRLALRLLYRNYHFDIIPRPFGNTIFLKLELWRAQTDTEYGRQTSADFWRWWGKYDKDNRKWLSKLADWVEPSGKDNRFIEDEVKMFRQSVQVILQTVINELEGQSGRRQY